MWLVTITVVRCGLYMYYIAHPVVYTAGNFGKQVDTLAKEAGGAVAPPCF